MIKTKEEFLELISKLLHEPVNEQSEPYAIIERIRSILDGDMSDALTHSSLPGRGTFLAAFDSIIDKTEMQLRYPFLFRKHAVAIVNIGSKTGAPTLLKKLSSLPWDAVCKNHSVPMLFDSDADYGVYSVTDYCASVEKNELEEIMNVYYAANSMIQLESVAKIISAPMDDPYPDTSVIYIPYFSSIADDTVRSILETADTVILCVGKDTKIIPLKQYLSFLKDSSFASVVMMSGGKCDLTGLDTELGAFARSLRAISPDELEQIIAKQDVPTDNNCFAADLSHELFKFRHRWETYCGKSDEFYSDFSMARSSYISLFSEEKGSREAIDDYFESTIGEIRLEKERNDDEKAACLAMAERILSEARLFQDEVLKEYPASEKTLMSYPRKMQVIDEMFTCISENKRNEAYALFKLLPDDSHKEKFRTLFQSNVVQTNKMSISKNLGTDPGELADEIIQRCRMFYSDELALPADESGKIACCVRGRLTGIELFRKGAYLSENTDKKAWETLVDAYESGEKRAADKLVSIAGDDSERLKNLAMNGVPQAAMRLYEMGCDQEEMYLRIAAAQKDLTAIHALADRIYTSTVYPDFVNKKDYPQKQEEKCSVLECLSLYEYIENQGEKKKVQSFNVKVALLYFLSNNKMKAEKCLETYKWSSNSLQVANYILGRLYEEKKRKEEAARQYGKVGKFKDAATRFNKLDGEIKAKREKERKMEEELQREEISYAGSSGCFS